MDIEEVEKLFAELTSYQEKKLLECASAVIPHITPDDLLQPNDYPELEEHPYFRYEEGVLKGIQTAHMAFLAMMKDLKR